MSQSELLRTRRFAPLFWTQFLGAFNDNVFRFALIIFVTFTVAEQRDMDTRSLVVLTGGVFILPFFLFSALAGQLADRFEKARLIRHIKTAEIVVMTLGALGFWLGSYEFLLAVLFLMGVQSTFFGPLKYGVLPQHLAESELTGGNALIQMGTYVAILVGGMAGGVLAGLGEAAPPAVIGAVIGVAVIGRLAAGFIPAAAASAPQLRIDYNPARSGWALMREVLATPGLMTLVMLISWFWFLGATCLGIVPSYGRVLLNADEHVVTLLNAAFTVGIGSGSLLVERASRGYIETGLVLPAALLLSLAAGDLWFVGIPAPPSATLTLNGFLSHPPALRLFADLAIIGAAGALYIVPLYAALQDRAPAAARARIIAALNITNALFMVVSAGFTMALFALGIDIPGIFGSIAVLTFMAVAAGALALPELGRRALQLFTARPGSGRRG